MTLTDAAALRPQTIQVLIVVAPILALTGAAVIFLRILKKRDGEVEPFELGVFYAAVVFLYGVFPLLSYLSGGLHFSRFAASRLFLSQPLPSEMARIDWYYFVYFSFFVAAYLLARGKCRIKKILLPRPDGRLLVVLIILLLSVKAFFVFLRLYYDIRNPESYIESYLQYSTLPLIVQQLVNHFIQIDLTLQVVLMAYLTFNFRKYKYAIFACVALEFLMMFFYGIGARTGLFVLIASLVITHHFAVRRLTIRSAVIVGALVLLLFVSFGALRDDTRGYADSPRDPLAYNNEFESVFSTSYDLLYGKGISASRAIPRSFYVSDFLNLVPQQLLPFQKIDLTRWYVETYYPTYAMSGGGLAFGVVPEAIVGLGWFDVGWRGAIIGVLFALIHRNFVNGKKSFWKYCFYLWTVIFAYQCFRNTTFRLVPQFFYEFLTVVIVSKIMLKILPRRKKSRYRLESSPVLAESFD